MTRNDHHLPTGQPVSPRRDSVAADVDSDVAGANVDAVEEAEMLSLDIDLGRVWNGIAGEMWGSPVGRIERIAAGLLGSPALARALVSTPSLVLSWIIASAVVFAIGAVVTGMTGTPIVPLVAPVIAAAGVSFAYGAGADPAYELARTMPTSARMILLVRVAVVLATNVVLAGIASLLAPSLAGLPGVTVLWLLPMLAIALLGLALATVSRSPTIGSVGALSVWGTIVLATEVRQSDVASAVSQSTLAAAAPLYGLLAAASVFVIVFMSADVTSAAGRAARRAAHRRGAGARW